MQQLNVCYLFTATDSETRTTCKHKDIVSIEEAENLKYLIGASALIECSVKNFIGIDDVFIEAVRSTRKMCKR